MSVQCAACGLLFYKGSVATCFADQKKLEQMERDTCPNFIAIQYDGGQKHTPEEHLFLLRNAKDAKKMKNMQGMRF